MSPFPNVFKKHVTQWSKIKSEFELLFQASKAKEKKTLTRGKSLFSAKLQLDQVILDASVTG